jgi:hypothetical protein
MTVLAYLSADSMMALLVVVTMGLRSLELDRRRSSRGGAAADASEALPLFPGEVGEEVADEIEAEGDPTDRRCCGCGGCSSDWRRDCEGEAEGEGEDCELKVTLREPGDSADPSDPPAVRALASARALSASASLLSSAAQTNISVTRRETVSTAEAESGACLLGPETSRPSGPTVRCTGTSVTDGLASGAATLPSMDRSRVRARTGMAQ